MSHDKITFTREYCLCRRIPYRIINEALYIGRFGKHNPRQFVCYSLNNLTYSDIIRVIDAKCVYDETSTFFIGLR